MRSARLLFAVATAAWLAVLLTAPITALGVPVSAATYALGSVICHQRPERSLHLAAAQLPVCARCFGLYLGAALGAIGALWLSVPRAIATSRWRTVILAAALPTVVTWSAEVAGLWSTSNPLRLTAALPLGAAVGLTVNYVEWGRPPRTGSRTPPTPI